MTTTLNRILLYVVVALMAVGGVQYALLQDAQHKLAAERVVTKQLKATSRGHTARAKAVASATKAGASRTEELSHATEANRPWADAAVPDAIWDSLYGPDAPPAAGVAGGLPVAPAAY